MLWSLAILSFSLLAPQPMVSEPLTAAIPPPQRVPLVTGGRAAAVLLVPDEPAFAALADELATGLRQALGVDLPRLPESGFRPDGRTAVVYGNAFTGPIARRLYANRLVIADGAVPGGGFELRSIADGLDYGPVLFLGGSSPDGVRAALAALVGQLTPAADLTLDRLVRVESPLAKVPPPTDEAIASAVAGLNKTFGSFASNKLYEAVGQLAGAARGYLLTGNDAFGRLYAGLLEATVAFDQANQNEPPTFVMDSLVMSFDQIEDSAGLTDTDRLRGAEWIRRLAEKTMVFWEMRQPVRRLQQQLPGPIWNHETHPALAMAHVAQFLRRRYQLPATDWWDAVVDYLFASQAAIDQPLEDSANYQWLVHQHTARYALATGRLPEFFGDAFRHHLDYLIASHDPLGHEATHGDAWEAFGSIAGGSLLFGAVVRRDPAYGFLYNLIGRPGYGGLWGYSGGLPASPPADHLGLRTFTVAPERLAAYGVEGVAPDEALDKAIVRTGWDSGAQYLMLDGLNVGNHKHLDANAIIRYVARRRLWLTDMDYIRAAPKHHNAVVVTRDGLAPDQRPAGRGGAQVIAAPPMVARLDGQAAGNGLAITQSTLPDYGGADWQRNLFWTPDGFVVIDRLTARQPGDYAFRCVWRTLGEAALEGSRLHARQRGEQSRAGHGFRIDQVNGRPVVTFTAADAAIPFELELPAGTARIQVIADGPHGSADSFWLHWGEAAPTNVSLPQNGLPAPAAAPAFDLTVPAGRQRFRLTLRESPGPRLEAILITGADGQARRLEAVDLVADKVTEISEPEQHFYIANADGAGVLLAEQLDYGHGGPRGYYASYPFAGPTTKVLTQVQRPRLAAGDEAVFANLLHRAEGQPAGRELRRVAPHVWVADGPNPLLVALGAVRLAGLEADAAALLVTPSGAVATAATRLAIGGAEARTPAPAATHLRFEGDREKRVRKLLADLFAAAPPAPQPAALHPLKAPGFEVHQTLTRPGDITALAVDGETIVTGDGTGKVGAVTMAGKLLWEHDAGSPVRSVAHVGGAGGGWAVGTAGGQALLLDPAGARRWAYTCQPYHGRSGSVATVFGADLDGDGSQEVVAGSDNHHYHGLSSEGKLLWRTETVHASTVGAAGDLTGDGRDDVVAGTEYYWPALLDGSGRKLAGLSGGPVTSAVLATDLDGDRRAEALVGMEDAYVRAYGGDGKLRWETNVGGTPTGMAVVPGEPGPVIAVGSDGFGIALLDGAGQRRRWVPLPAAVRALIASGDRLVAACDDGAIYALSAEGDLLGACAAPAPATALAPLPGQHAAAACGPWLVIFNTADANERTRG